MGWGKSVKGLRWWSVKIVEEDNKWRYNDLLYEHDNKDLKG